MVTVRQALVGALRDLRELRPRFALIGGLAVSARCEPRTTRDVDLAVGAVDDQEAESLVRELGSRGYVVLSSVEQDATGRLATVRLRPPGAGPQGAVVDLLFASSGIEREVVERAEVLAILRGVEAPVARTGDLIALKILSRDDETRPQDGIDLRALLSVASGEEVGRARAALELITARGSHRGRDLIALLDAAVHGPGTT
jgi:predicted nucleotidyltransferase